MPDLYVGEKIFIRLLQILLAAFFVWFSCQPLRDRTARKEAAERAEIAKRMRSYGINYP